MIRFVFCLVSCIVVATLVVGCITLVQLAAGVPIVLTGLPFAYLTAVACSIVTFYLSGEPNDEN